MPIFLVNQWTTDKNTNSPTKMIMSHTIDIKGISVVKQYDRDAVEVKVEVNDGENKKPVLRKFGYPLGTTKEEVVADLKNVVAGLDSDADHQASIAEREKQLKEVAKMHKELTGTSLGAPKKKKAKKKK